LFFVVHQSHAMEKEFIVDESSEAINRAISQRCNPQICAAKHACDEAQATLKALENAYCDAYHAIWQRQTDATHALYREYDQPLTKARQALEEAKAKLAAVLKSQGRTRPLIWLFIVARHLYIEGISMPPTIANVITAMREHPEEEAILQAFPEMTRALAQNEKPLPSNLGALEVSALLGGALENAMPLPVQFARAFRNRAIYLAMATASAQAQSTTAVFACRRPS
jgi:hypothetical protein